MDRNVTAGQHRKQSHRRLQAATQMMIENLEGRQLLSARNPYSLANVPTFTATTTNIADVKHGPLAKGGQALIDIYKEYTRFVKAGGNRYAFSSALADTYVIEGRNVLVTMRVKGDLSVVTTNVANMNGRVVYTDASRAVVEAYVPINQVTAITSQSNVLTVRPERPRRDGVGWIGCKRCRAIGKEPVHRAGVRRRWNRQTVGVISDSYDAFGGAFHERRFRQSTHRRQCLQDDFGEDEGRAMLELVHDIAPGAGLAFSAGGPTLDTFADSVRNLRDAGSSVIVDDLSFATSPYFGEGVLEKAIDDVVDNGAMYFTAQRNSGSAGYSAPTSWVADPDKSGGLINDFDPSSKVDTKLRINIKQAGELFLQWDNSYDGTVANVTADVDFYLYRDGALISSSIDDNFTTGVPLEMLTVDQPGQYDIVIRTDRLAKGAQPPTYFKFSANGNEDGMFNGLTDVEYPGNNSTAVGQTAARGAIAVGAVDNSDSNAFGRSRNYVNESFSSSGPVTRIFDDNGNRLAEPETILAPLFSGIDGTNTSVSSLFAPFFGTSAAAPNVAAVAALLRQISPASSPEQIKDALVASAKTQPLNGTPAGQYDNQGRLRPDRCGRRRSRAQPECAGVDFSVPAVNSGKVSSATVTFSEPVTGLDISDFTLNRDGTSVNRFRGGETVTTSDGGTTWTINNLASATGTLGSYTLALRNARTDVEDADGNVAAGNIISFDVTLRKVRSVSIAKLDDGQIRLRFDASGTNADAIRIQRATDANFSTGIRNIDVAADATEYIDSAVTPGTQYFYRIRP